MDIAKEINNHLAWIETLASLLDRETIPSEELNTIAQHESCALGQWLNTKAAEKYNDHQELQQLIQSHESFHKLAADLITAIQQHNEDAALQIQAQFIEESQKVIRYLKTLQAYR